MHQAQKILAKEADLGDGLVVRRALPTRERRMVGAWCFLDHAGPVTFESEKGMKVGAHPHTCLQTFTWLIEGEVLHRDSLGNEQIIRPGQVNLMTAGHGISHTEDSLPTSSRLHAAQLWIALPREMADCPPAFEHYPDLPCWQQEGARFTLLAGRYGGHSAPTRLHSPLLGMDIQSPHSGALEIELLSEFEYGILPLEGALTIENEVFGAGQFAYFGSGGQRLAFSCEAGSRLLVLGGAPAEAIQMWWNFVGYSKADISQARHEWETHGSRFGDVTGSENRRLKAPPLPWADV